MAITVAPSLARSAGGGAGDGEADLLEQVDVLLRWDAGHRPAEDVEDMDAEADDGGQVAAPSSQAECQRRVPRIVNDRGRPRGLALKVTAPA
jgi:hypothetical protein